MRSRGANTPFMDTELYGRVEATMVAGEFVYRA
jgi:dihydroorotase-like cyclic amidohydrolase